MSTTPLAQATHCSATDARRSLSLGSLLVGLLSVGLLPSPLLAKSKTDLGFPSEVVVAEQELTVNGEGKLKYKWGLFRFHLYDAVLYTSEASKQSSKVLDSDVSKKLVLRFAREIEQEKMREAFGKSFDLLAGDRQKKLQPMIDRFLQTIPGVDDDHVFEFTAPANGGLSVKIRNGTPVVFDDAEFAKLFFELYLAPKAPNADLRKKLLGRS